MDDVCASRCSRRRALRTAALAGSLSLAGCLGDLAGEGAETTPTETGSETPTDAEAGGPGVPEIEDPPAAVYTPTHREAMRMLEPVSVGDYGFAPMVTYPHRFWTVSGRTVERADPTGDDDVHLMVTAWDRETGVVIPIDAGISFSVYRGDDLVVENNPWSMLSQQMGFHFGDNLPLAADGTYRVEGRIGGVSARKTGAFEGRFEEPVSFEFEFEFDQELRDLSLEVEYFDEDRWGEPGAIEPMTHGAGNGSTDNEGTETQQPTDDDATDEGGRDAEQTAHEVPYSAAPPVEALPGSVQGTPTTGDAVVATTILESGSRFAADARYLAVSPRTPYNRCVLPAMTLEATVGETTVDLVPTLDGALGYHYGAALESVADGDDLTIDVLAPPQVARHQGYETAFLEMPAVTFTLSL